MRQHTVHRTLLRMVPCSCRPARVPMLTPVHCRKHLQKACELQNWTLEQWKKVAWSEESRFLLQYMDGQVRVHRLPGEEMAPGCTWKKTSRWRDYDALDNVLPGNPDSGPSCGHQLHVSPTETYVGTTSPCIPQNSQTTTPALA